MREYDAQVASQLAAAEKKSAKRLAKKKDAMGVDSGDSFSSSDDDESVSAEVIDDGEQTNEGGRSYLDDLFDLEQSRKDEEAFNKREQERRRQRKERQRKQQEFDDEEVDDEEGNHHHDREQDLEKGTTTRVAASSTSRSSGSRPSSTTVVSSKKKAAPKRSANNSKAGPKRSANKSKGGPKSTNTDPLHPPVLGLKPAKPTLPVNPNKPPTISGNNALLKGRVTMKSKPEKQLEVANERIDKLENRVREDQSHITQLTKAAGEGIDDLYDFISQVDRVHKHHQGEIASLKQKIDDMGKGTEEMSLLQQKYNLMENHCDELKSDLKNAKQRIVKLENELIQERKKKPTYTLQEQRHHAEEMERIKRHGKLSTLRGKYDIENEEKEKKEDEKTSKFEDIVAQHSRNKGLFATGDGTFDMSGNPDSRGRASRKRQNKNNRRGRSHSRNQRRSSVDYFNDDFSEDEDHHYDDRHEHRRSKSSSHKKHHSYFEDEDDNRHEHRRSKSSSHKKHHSYFEDEDDDRYEHRRSKSSSRTKHHSYSEDEDDNRYEHRRSKLSSRKKHHSYSEDEDDYNDHRINSSSKSSGEQRGSKKRSSLSRSRKSNNYGGSHQSQSSSPQKKKQHRQSHCSDLEEEECDESRCYKTRDSFDSDGSVSIGSQDSEEDENASVFSGVEFDTKKSSKLGKPSSVIASNEDKHYSGE
eukprot:scaffold33635_cov188-Skeletonema_dohrnii-CCMP3373.AAC.2